MSFREKSAWIMLSLMAVVYGVYFTMGLAMFEVPYFWIANAILAGLVLSEIVSGITKVVLYRRGF